MRANSTATAAELDDPIGDGLEEPGARASCIAIRDRVLLKLVSVCAVYCRFCFRREMVGPGEPGLDEAGFRRRARLYSRASGNLGGGADRRRSAGAFAAPPRRGDAALAEIPHVKVLRWHTRLPVAAPERVTAALARALTDGHDKAVYVALHANHPRELTPQARAACARLRPRASRWSARACC